MTQTCGRRNSHLGPWTRGEGLDTWYENVPGWQHCSFCGSLSQDAFFKAVEQGAFIIPTDKEDKAYISGSIFVDRSTLFTREEITALVAKQGASALHALQATRVEAENYTGPSYIKFYFQHLDTDGQHEFIRLYNERRMLLGEPGYFYVRPFFCKRLGG